MKNNKNEQFDGLKKDLNKIQIVPQTELSLTEQNNNMRSELNDALPRCLSCVTTAIRLPLKKIGI